MILTSPELTEMRHACARVASVGEINYTKGQVNAALQAVEDVFTSAALKTALNNAINTATAPLVLNANQKQFIVKAVLAQIMSRWA